MACLAGYGRGCRNRHRMLGDVYVNVNFADADIQCPFVS